MVTPVAAVWPSLLTMSEKLIGWPGTAVVPGVETTAEIETWGLGVRSITVIE